MEHKLEGRKEILAFLGWGDWRRVVDACKRGMPVVKVGGRWVAFGDQIEAWLRAQPGA